MNDGIVLPETLVAQLIDNAAALSEHLTNDFHGMTSRRPALRNGLVAQRRILRINSSHAPVRNVHVVDGAHVAEIDRASAYSVSCAVRVGPDTRQDAQSSCLAILPHVACIDALSTGLMLMQEIMLAVEAVESSPDALCLIDGSRVSACIGINQFYAGISRDIGAQLARWREQCHVAPDREPGRTLARFEARDWLTPYLSSPRIVGNVKLVTTTGLIDEQIPEWRGRFDDKTFAALILEAGEMLAPIGLNPPDEPHQMHCTFPHAKPLSTLTKELTLSASDHRLYHIYLRPDEAHGVFKLELSRVLLTDTNTVRGVITYFLEQLCAPDLMEPYAFYVADRFAKEAVSVAKDALREIVKRDANSSQWAWFFTEPYRTAN